MLNTVVSKRSNECETNSVGGFFGETCIEMIRCPSAISNFVLNESHLGPVKFIRTCEIAGFEEMGRLVL